MHFVRPKNIGGGERLASVLGGSALAWYALRRPFNGARLAALVGGGALAARGIAGYSKLYELAGVLPTDATPFSHPLSRRMWRSAAVTIARPPEELLPLLAAQIERFLPGFTVRGGASGDVEGTLVLAGAPEALAWEMEPPSSPGTRRFRAADGSVACDGTLSIHPAPGRRGSEVVVRLGFTTAGGVPAALVQRLRGRDPGRMLRGLLRDLKRAIECGELPVTEGQPRGTC